MSFKTQEQVDRLRMPKGKADHWEFDAGCSGLSVRLQGKRRTWVVWYTRPDGARRKVTIGDVAAVRLREARQKATEVAQAARKGEDPGAQRRAAREAARAQSERSLRRLIDVYLERRARPAQRPRSYQECERSLIKHWAPLHERPAENIARRDVFEVVDQLRRERGAPTARNSLRYMSAVYSWGMRAGLVENNPCIAVEAPVLPPSRARVLAPEELVAVWRACEHAGDFGRIVRLLMITGARRLEGGHMAWSELDLTRKIWIIPARRTKNGREHEVPLSDQAIALLPERRGELVFGGRVGRQFSGWSHAKHALDRAAGIASWRLHDLRHSFVTHANEIGVDPHIIEAAVNHASGFRGGIAGRYNSAKYREQKRAAMIRYAQWIEGLLSGEQRSSVVAFG